MSKFSISFYYNNIEISIQFDQNLKFKDIINIFAFKTKSEGKNLYFMYNGNLINNTEQTFNEIANNEDKLREKMNVLVGEIGKDSQLIKSRSNYIIKPKNIICPECKEDIQFFIKDYVITLSDCKNNHKKENIFLDKFDETQNIDISKIICQKCKKYNKGNVHNNTFYKCNTCEINLCPICYSNHDKKHYILNYDDKNLICKKHNKQFTQYCYLCKKNICIYCEKEHKNHELISFGQLINDEKELNSFLDNLKGIIKKFNEEVEDLINKLNKIKENMSHYYCISKSIIQNFNKEKLNYEILNNINSIIHNEDISFLDDVINNTNIYNKIKYFIDIYHKMNGKKDLILNEQNIYNSENSAVNSLRNSVNSEYLIPRPIQIENLDSQEINPIDNINNPNSNITGIEEMNYFDNSQISSNKNINNYMVPMQMNNIMPIQINNMKPENNNMMPGMNNMMQGINNIKPGMNDKMPGINNMMPVMNDKMPGMNNMMSEMNNMEPEINTMMPGMNNMIPGINNMMPGKNNMMPRKNKMMQGMNNMNPEMNNMKPEMNIMMPRMNNMMPGMNNMMPGMNNMIPVKNNMMPGMNNMMPGMNNMIPGKNNMMPGKNNMMPGMNDFMPMDSIPFLNHNLLNDNDDEDIHGWNLIFEQQENKRVVTIKIKEQKLFKEAISKYLLIIGVPFNRYMFIYNGKELNPLETIGQMGLGNGSKILVFNRN